MKTCKTLMAVAICLAVAGVASAIPPVFSADIAITGDLDIVLGETTTLTATWSTNDQDVTWCEWLVDGVGQGPVEIPDGGSSGSSTFDFTPTATGDYEIGFHIWHHVHTERDGLAYVTVTVTDPQGDWRTETAFGGDSEGGGAAWWYYFDTSGDEVQDIWAGQDEDAGDVTIADAGGGNVTITIDLGAGWELQDVAEPVKIQGFNDGDLPTERLPAGLFTTYKGSDLAVTVPAYDYFVIQLDVRIWEADSQ
jgi:hypothetical protein